MACKGIQETKSDFSIWIPKFDSLIPDHDKQILYSKNWIPDFMDVLTPVSEPLDLRLQSKF